MVLLITKTEAARRRKCSEGQRKHSKTQGVDHRKLWYFLRLSVPKGSPIDFQFLNLEGGRDNMGENFKPLGMEEMIEI